MTRENAKKNTATFSGDPINPSSAESNAVAYANGFSEQLLRQLFGLEKDKTINNENDTKLAAGHFDQNPMATGSRLDADEMDENADSDILWHEFLSFTQTWESLIQIYVPLEMVIMSLGLLGNLLAFVTLIRSCNLNTPSIIYHKTFVLADLIFCANYFFNNVIVDKVMMVGGQENQFEFVAWWAAYYSGVIYRVIHLICTYLISYMTLVITFDRFSALIMYRRYQKFNKNSVASFMVFCCVVLSATVHSWSAWVLRIVLKTSELSNSHASKSDLTYENQSTAYTWIKNQDLHKDMKTALQVCSLYNGIMRLIYPFVVFILTGSVIYGFVKRQKHIAERYASSRNAGRQRARYERTLFVFMVSVVVLAFIQIISSEFRRFIEILYPPGDVTTNKIIDTNLPVVERVRYFRILLYGYQVSRVLSNLCTAINHSFVCYLYIAMNKVFRKELWALVRCRPVQRAGILRARTMSVAAAVSRKTTRKISVSVVWNKNPRKWTSTAILRPIHKVTVELDNRLSDG